MIPQPGETVMEGDPPDDEALVRLAFGFAGRLDTDQARTYMLRMAAGAQTDLLVEDLASAVVHHGAPVTAGELALINQGLQWLDSTIGGGQIDASVAVSDAELEAHLRRWRFEPAQPSGEPYEQAAIPVLEDLPEARALVTAWRVAPDGDRVRAWCVVCEPGRVWTPIRVWERLHHGWLKAVGGALPESAGLAPEAVGAGQPWTIYHRRLLEAAQPVWTRRQGGRA